MPPDISQNASPQGSGNIVVQIVGERNAVTIGGATALRLREYLGKTFASAPPDAARAGEPGYTATGRRETSILAPTNRASLPLQGRADLLGRLRDWLAAPDPLSVHALIGGGGRGKTRLAVELTAAARARGWTAGFARQEELTIFRGTGCRTAWNAKTLVVIDYAAAKAAEIATWLRALVHEAEAPDRPPLRILLLERLGGEGVAWWREVFGAPGREGEAVADLLAPGAPLTVGPLAEPAERHAVFAAAFRAARDAAAPPRDPALDDALSRASLGGEPLFLAMFGLIAARQGLDAAKALPADRIALDLAAQELERIGRVWRAHGLPMGKDRPLHAHLAAVAALCEGLGEDAAHAAIARESAALHQAIPAGGTEPARAALQAALPGEAGGIAAIQPDILAEAAMIRAWERLPDGGVEAVRRAAAVPGQREAVTRSVVRACQDFLIRGQKAPLAWLKSLQADIADLEALFSLSNAMPADTVELRETALELAMQLAELARALPDELGEPADLFRSVVFGRLATRLAAVGLREEALAASEDEVAVDRRLVDQDPETHRASFASSLNNLSNRLSDLGRREAALAAIEEAVSLSRTLAAARPDAFLPGLATSLGARGRILAAEDPGGAARSFAEGVEALRPLFLALPPAYAPLMGALCRGYIEARAAAGQAPDMALLAPITAVLHDLAAEEADRDGQQQAG